MTSTSPFVSRRALLAGVGVTFGAAFLPPPASAAGARDPRLIVVILRGALDGLAAIPPVGDPNYAELRSSLAFSRSGDHAGVPLDDFFVAHPALRTFTRLFTEKRAAVVHAVATPYRERSHFDGQDVLESGYPIPGRTDSGWLNRAVAQFPHVSNAPGRGLGVGVTAPLTIRGPAQVLGWAPQGLPDAADALAQRVLDLYAHTDPSLATSLRAGLETERLATSGVLPETMRKARGGMDQPAGVRQAAAGAARLLATPDGPRIAAMAFDGYDTHANEGAAQGQLANRLAGLDGAFDEFEKGLGEHWTDTIVVAITEFGRTARVNGTNGTDHGTATVAFLAGGAVNGGRVVTQWPGLSQNRLYQGRDLYPTMDLRAVLKGVLANHIGISARALAGESVPQFRGDQALAGARHRVIQTFSDFTAVLAVAALIAAWRIALAEEPAASDMLSSDQTRSPRRRRCARFSRTLTQIMNSLAPERKAKSPVNPFSPRAGRADRDKPQSCDRG